jgi:hypothetical protein
MPIINSKPRPSILTIDHPKKTVKSILGKIFDAEG